MFSNSWTPCAFSRVLGALSTLATAALSTDIAKVVSSLLVSLAFKIDAVAFARGNTIPASCVWRPRSVPWIRMIDQLARNSRTLNGTQQNEVLSIYACTSRGCSDLDPPVLTLLTINRILLMCVRDKFKQNFLRYEEGSNNRMGWEGSIYGFRDQSYRSLSARSGSS